MAWKMLRPLVCERCGVRLTGRRHATRPHCGKRPKPGFYVASVVSAALLNTHLQENLEALS
jgi:hypothetical protein